MCHSDKPTVGTGDRYSLLSVTSHSISHSRAHIRRDGRATINTLRTLRAHGSTATTVVDQRALLRKGLGTTTACFEPIRSTRGAVAT